MIRYTTLREIIGADTLIAHTGTHLATAHTVVFRLDTLLLDFIQLTGQHTHTLFPVLQLAAFLLASHHDATGFVDQAHCGAGFIDVLSTGTAGTIDLHFDILGVDLHIHLFHFRQHCHGSSRGMDTAAGLGFRHTLHPMDTGLILQSRPCASTIDDEIRFFHAAQFRIAVIEQFDTPTHFGGIHAIHTEQTMGKEGAFLTANTATDLHDDAFLVIGIFGQQQDPQLVTQLLHFFLGLLEGLLAKIPHFRIRHQFLGISQVLLCPAVLQIAFRNGLQVILFPQQFGCLLGIVIKIRLFRFGTQLFIAAIDSLQFIQHGITPYCAYCTNFSAACKGFPLSDYR